MACRLCEMKSKTILEMNQWNEEAGKEIDKLKKQVAEYQNFIFDLGYSIGEELKKQPRCPECDTVHQRLPDGIICHRCTS